MTEYEIKTEAIPVPVICESCGTAVTVYVPDFHTRYPAADVEPMEATCSCGRTVKTDPTTYCTDFRAVAVEKLLDGGPECDRVLAPVFDETSTVRDGLAEGIETLIERLRNQRRAKIENDIHDRIERSEDD